MNTETQVSTGDETQNQAPEAVEPEVTTPEVAEVEVEAKPEDLTDKALKQMQRRIDKRTAQFYRTQAENEQLKQRLAQQEAGPATETPTTDPMTLAREIARVDRFTEKANALVTEGTKKHSDYMQALKELSMEVGDFVQKNGAPSPFMDVVLEVSEKPTALLYHLGKNPDVAAELADLTPVQLAKRLDRIERDLATPKTSNAPKPLEPIKGKASESDLGPGLSDAEWMKRREAQIKANRER